MFAPYESDAQIAFLCRNNYADIAITEDSDLLVYGCRHVIFKLNLTGSCVYVNLEQYRENKELRRNV